MITYTIVLRGPLNSPFPTVERTVQARNGNDAISKALALAAEEGMRQGTEYLVARVDPWLGSSRRGN